MSIGNTPKQKESDNEKALAEVGLAKWNRYKETYVPREKDLFARVEKFGSREAKDQMVGESVMAAKKGLGAPKNIDPNQGGGLQIARHGLKTASTAGKAASQGVQDAEDRKTQGLNLLSDLGRGLDLEASKGLTRAAYASNQEGRTEALVDAERKASNQAALGTVAGTAAGIGMNEGWFGQNAQRAWKEGV